MFFAGIYSSSPAFAAKGIVTTCVGISTTAKVCTTIDDEFKDVSEWKCTTSDGGKTWKCDKMKTAEAIPPGLKDALTGKVQANIIDDNNDTKVPKDFLNKGGLLTEDSQITTEDNQITANKESSPTPPPCPNTGPIPPDCTMKPLLK